MHWMSCLNRANARVSCAEPSFEPRAPQARMVEAPLRMAIAGLAAMRVDPDRAGLDTAGHGEHLARVVGVDTRGEHKERMVGHRDAFLLVVIGVEGNHGPEELTAEADETGPT